MVYYKLKFISFTLICIVSIFYSCSIKEKDDKEIRSVATSLSTEIKSGNFSQIQNIATEKGFESILIWSDSLNNEKFIKSLASNLENFNVFDVSDVDSLVIISIGESDAIVGATGGYIFLKKENNKYKIDLYRGGK